MIEGWRRSEQTPRATRVPSCPPPSNPNERRSIMRTYAQAVADTDSTKSGPSPTIDGVTLMAGDYVLLTGQMAASPAGSDNGLWEIGTPWTRATEADTDEKLR